MIKDWQSYNPVKIISGVGCINKLNSLVETGNWLLLTSPGFTKRGYSEQLKSKLNNINLFVFDKISPNPELEELESMTNFYRNKLIIGIIALGGGSVLDAAKILSVTLCSSLDKPLIQTLRESKPYKWERKLHLITIPTTSGTGAEVTPFATVWDKPFNRKYSVVGDDVFPDVALMDPELSLTLPDFETLYTGLDSISHALESLWNISRSPISESLCVHSLELSLSTLPRIQIGNLNIEDRAKMQQASLLSGLAISQTRTAIAHSISYPLTSHYNVPHGIACSFTLPTIIDEYLIFNPSENNKKLLLRAKDTINSFGLSRIIKNYVNENEIKSKVSEMFHPDRAGNYVGILNPKFIENVIKKSLSYK
jgi:phosphonate metabolism-associated iron-containing alcohol dehydrogenase